MIAGSGFLRSLASHVFAATMAMANSRWTIAVAALTATASFGDAHAQSVLGKTLRGSQTIGYCTKDKCGEVSGNFNVYVSSKGQVFDYSNSQGGAGTVARLGQSVNGGKWSVRGNRLILNKAEVITIYTVQGSTCDQSTMSAYKNVTLKTVAQSCTVIDGQSER